MFYKKFGNTGDLVSAIGFGAMRYDETEDFKTGRYEKCAELPLFALEKGINYWDTAPFYCEDKCETITGIALSQVKRSDVFITSKINLFYLGDDQNKDISSDTFRRRLDTSLRRLKTDYIDFYYMWCMLTPDTWAQHMEKLYDFFAQAKAEGLIKHIAVSSHMQGNQNIKIVDSNKFEAMMIGYNVLNYQFRQEGLKRAYDKGIGVVAMNPLGGGILLNRPDLFGYLTEGTEQTIAQAALRFVASHKEITVTLVGCTKTEQIESAAAAVTQLTEKDADEILREDAVNRITLNNLCTGCSYCRECPNKIEIPKYMDAYNQYILTGNKSEIKERTIEHWGLAREIAANCTACGRCEKSCTQHLPIIQRLKEIAENIIV
jgi:predicted aldo/keto reductase-like oxidoreductase